MANVVAPLDLAGQAAIDLADGVIADPNNAGLTPADLLLAIEIELIAAGADAGAAPAFAQARVLAAGQRAALPAFVPYAPGAGALGAAPGVGPPPGLGPGPAVLLPPGAAPPAPVVLAAIAPAGPAFGIDKLGIPQNLRNGRQEAIAPVARQASLDVSRHRVPIPWVNAQAPGVPVDYEGLRTAESRGAFLQAASESVPGVRAAGTDAAAAAAAAADLASCKVGYLIGAARSGFRECFQVTEAEYLPNEVSVRFLYCVDGTDGRVKVHPRATPRDLAVAAALPDPSAAMGELMAATYLMGVGAFVQAGKLLFEAHHHYFSSNPARAKAIEAQALTSTAAKTLYDAEKEVFRTLIFHNSVHVVVPGLMMDVATDAQTPGRLESAGLASAAVGVPATEALVKTATTMLTCVNGARVPLQVAGHKVSVPGLERAHAAVMAHAIGSPERNQAIAGPLRLAVARAAGTVAYAFGYTQATLEDAPRAGTTILQAYSLANVQQQHPTSYAMGFNQVSLDKRAARRAVDNDKMLIIELTDV